jgi:hypothetical protein
MRVLLIVFRYLCLRVEVFLLLATWLLTERLSDHDWTYRFYLQLLNQVQ